jgi:hypothetical protein
VVLAIQPFQRQILLQGLFRLTFNSDGTMQSDSLGLNPEVSDWSILNGNLLILDGDTFSISLLTTANFNFSQSFTEDFGSDGILTQDLTIKLIK